MLERTSQLARGLAPAAAHLPAPQATRQQPSSGIGRTPPQRCEAAVATMHKPHVAEVYRREFILEMQAKGKLPRTSTEATDRRVGLVRQMRRFGAPHGGVGGEGGDCGGWRGRLGLGVRGRGTATA